MSGREALMARLDSRAALLRAVRGLQVDIERVIAEVGEARLEQPGSFGEWTFSTWPATTPGATGTGRSPPRGGTQRSSPSRRGRWSVDLRVTAEGRAGFAVEAIRRAGQALVETSTPTTE